MKDKKHETDDEIEIDFSKIKRLFTKKKKKEMVTEVEEGVNRLKEEIETKISEDEKEIEELKKEDKELDEMTEELKETHETKKNDNRSSDDEDDEISIDFSKIKKIFTSEDKKKTTDKHQKDHEDTDEDEISFDISKIKSIFSGKKKEEKQVDDEELSFDTKALWDFVRTHKVLLLLVIPLFLSIFLRIQPDYLPITDDWATSSVHNFFKSQIRAQIDQQYPNLPAANKNSLVETEFKKFLEQNNAMVEEQITGTSNYFKSRLKNDKDNTYLLAIDPYFWMRHARNILENGHPGDELRNRNTFALCYERTKDCIPWDNHMYAPNGRQSDVSFHSYFMAYTYKFVHFFNDDAELMGVAFYLPVLVSALAVIPAFFIARKIAGDFGGLVSAVLVAIHPSFLSRTAGGFADTDAYNVMFPLFIMWFFFEAFEEKNIQRKVIYTTLAAFSSALYFFTWIGSWFIFDFILGVAGIYLLYALVVHIKRQKRFNIGDITKNQAIRNTFLLIVSFMVLTALFTGLFFGFGYGVKYVLNAPMQPLEFSKIKVVGIYSIWPNVFTTVAEQNESNFRDVIQNISLGNRVLFFISIVGIILTMIQRDSNGNINIKEAILLTLWYCATIYAAVKGVRFLLLLVPAFSIAFGVAIGITYQFLSKWVAKNLHINKIIARSVIIIVFCLLLINPYKSAYATAKNEIPSMNDAWWASLEGIRTNSTEDAIINSWWDFGHWFKYIGDRAVTFDGTSQGTPQAHWIGNTLLTSDEETAIGILRMVDCSGKQGGTYAYNAAHNITEDVPKAIDLLYEIMPVGIEEARDILVSKGISQQQIDDLLINSHCNPPENYFITSDDMIGKSGVWAHFGSWDFDRALIYNRLKNRTMRNNMEKSVEFLVNRFNFSESAAENMYYEVQSIQTNSEANTWIAPWPSYASGFDMCSTSQEGMITCSIGNGGNVEINLDTLEGNITTTQGVMHLQSVVLVTEDGFREKTYDDNLVGELSILVAPVGDGQYKRLLMSPQLTKSMFTRLFYLDGHGTHYFQKFSDMTTVFGGRIIVWKVDWEGNQDNRYSYFVQEEENATEQPMEDTEQVVEATEENASGTDVTNKSNNESISITIE